MNWLAIIIITATTSVSTVVTIPATDKEKCEAAIHSYLARPLPVREVVTLCVNGTTESIFGKQP